MKREPEVVELFLSPASFDTPEFECPSAWREHAPFVFWLVDRLQPRTVVELGSHHGFSYMAMCQRIRRSNLDTRAYAIDTWAGDEHAGFYGDEVYQRLRESHDPRYAHFSELIRATFDEAASRFAPKSIDLLHIDGRHFYEDVRHDFETWLPLVSKQGVVLFHDTNVFERNFGVHQLWKELSSRHDHFEFLHGHGLGVLSVGSTPPESLAPFFQARRSPMQYSAVRQAYAKLGKHVACSANIKDQALHAATLEHLVARVMRSKSWRVTKPLRGVRRVVSRLFGALHRRTPQMISIGLQMLEKPQASLTALARTRSLPRKLRRPMFVPLFREEVQRTDVASLWKRYAEALAERKPLFKAQSANLERRPLIHLVMTTKTADEAFQATLKSILDQAYGCWQLTVFTGDEVSIDFNTIAGSNGSITVRSLRAAQNDAQRSLSGDYVAIITPGTKLLPHALLRVAQIANRETFDQLFTDSISITCDNNVAAYFLRPAYSKEFAKSYPPSVGGLVVYRSPLFSLTDLLGHGSQPVGEITDHRHTPPRTIIHIPEILQAEPVTSANLPRHNVRTSHYKPSDVVFASPSGLRIGIIIPTRNGVGLLKRCIDSLKATTTGIPYSLLIVDNASDCPQTLEYLSGLGSQAQILRYPGEFNFSAMNNDAVKALDPRCNVLLFCNNDIIASEFGWLDRLAQPLSQRDIAVVGARLLYPDRRHIQHLGVTTGLFGCAENTGRFMPIDGSMSWDPIATAKLYLTHEVTAVTAACLLVKREAFNLVEGFDPNLRIGFGDVDLCLRIREKNLRVLMRPSVSLVHHESMTRGFSSSDPHPEDTARFMSKWKNLIATGDPFYNPNYTRTSRSFGLRSDFIVPLEPEYRITQSNA